MTAQFFIDSIAAAASASMRQSKIPASFTIAEGALESGWGSSVLYEKAKNIFGVKVYPGWKGEILTLPTREYINERWEMVEAKWCIYHTYLECILDHARFILTEPRYSGCFAHPYSGAEFAIEIQRAGYATDPDYAEKIGSIIRQHGLIKYDVA